MDDELTARASQYLNDVCRRFPDRHVGGPGNRAAVDLFERVAEAAGFEVRSTEFDCVEWDRGEVVLEVDGDRFTAFAGPYSLPCDLAARLAVVSTVEELEAGSFGDTVLLVRGDLAREQLMPKGFEFYNPERHQRIVSALEAQSPAAIVAATGRSPGLAGGAYPFPLLEDADFDIPNAYMTDVEGERLGERVEDRVVLRIESGRIPARARQLVARKSGSSAAAGSPGSGRIVVSAHIDSKEGTPGALDNGTGVVALLLLAGLLAKHEGRLAVELVPFNGEDYYAAPGQVVYLRENAGRLGDIVLAMNVDGAGHVGAGTAVSLYGATPSLQQTARATLARRRGLAEGEPWPQGDHSLFVMNGRPALAVTSEDFMQLSTDVTHTEKDVPELVDSAAVAEVGRFLADMVVGLDDAVVPVKMFGLLHEYRREKGLPSSLYVAVPFEGTTAADVALELALPLEMIEGAFVNGIVYGVDHPVRRGDRLAFVPYGTPGPHRFFLGLYRAGQVAERLGGDESGEDQAAAERSVE